MAGEVAMQAAQPIGVYEDLREAYLRYYDTAFRVADAGIARERRERLTQPGVIFTEPVLEAVMPVASGRTVGSVCAEAGLSEGVARRLARAVFDAGPEFMLYRHQSDALRSALSSVEPFNPIVTAGTGSGKTESFLLPILARLLGEAEREAWPAGQDENRWWDGRASGRWEASRDPVSPRPAGVTRTAAVSNERARGRPDDTHAPGRAPRSFWRWSAHLLRPVHRRDAGQR